MTQLIDSVLPSSAVAVETREERDVELFPEEERALGRAVEKRRREFVSGRACAREALAALGVGPVPLGSGPRGEPLWPDGIVGSITHCEGYRACALARSSEWAALGIDAERDAALREGVWETVAHGDELALRSASAAGGPHLDAVVFSAKEAIYKAWFPLERRQLGFEDVEVRIDAATGTFSAALLVPGPLLAGARPAELAGRWAARDGIVVTALAMPADGGEPAG